MDEYQKEFLKKLENLTQEDIEKEEAEYEKIRPATLIDVAKTIIEVEEEKEKMKNEKKSSFKNTIKRCFGLK